MGSSRKAEVEPKKKLAEFRVDAENLLDVGDLIQADHFVPGQKVDVTGVTIGRGFTGAMKRWNFRGLKPATASRSRIVRWAVPADARIRARPSRTRRCTAITASINVTTQNLEVAKVDVERGLIMIRGAVPGSKGGWVMVRDAVKQPRPRKRR